MFDGNGNSVESKRKKEKEERENITNQIEDDRVKLLNNNNNI